MRQRRSPGRASARAHTRRSFLWSACMLLAAWLLPALTSAQPNTAEPAGYRAAIASGLEEFDLGNYEEAREQFTRAHNLFPNARTLRGLGMAEFELRDYVEAIRYLEQALASSVRPLEGALRQETQALLTRARGYVGELRLHVEPASAILIVDGVQRHDSLPERLSLDVGDHVLELQASGHNSERRTLRVRGGSSQTLEIKLTALALATTAPRPEGTRADSEASPARTPLYKRWWLWTAVAVVVAGAATGVAVALTHDSNPPAYEPVPSQNTPTGVRLNPLWER